MDQQQRSQARLIVEHHVERSTVGFAERLKAIYVDHAAKASLMSGATIKVAIRSMEELTTSLISKCIDEVASVAMDVEAFALVREAVESMFPQTPRRTDQQLPSSKSRKVERHGKSRFTGSHSRSRQTRARLIASA